MAIFYVKTDGSDNQSGLSDASAWRTWRKAFNATEINPGDTVYFRGGVYYKTSTDNLAWPYDQGSPLTISCSGVSDNWITYEAYPSDYNIGNYPIFDCSLMVPSYLYSGGTLLKNFGISNGGDYIHFKGLSVTNVVEKPDPSITTEVEGWIVGNGHFIFENCKMYDIGGRGFYSSIDAEATHTFLNCDAWNCSNPLAHTPYLPGNRGVGFSSQNFSNTLGHAYAINCRAWNCGDQGFSWNGDHYCEVDGCWSFDNGLLQGDGHGFKLGWNDLRYNGVRHVLKNSIAAHNKYSGIVTNDDVGVSSEKYIYNNFIYKNGWGSTYLYGIYIMNTLDSDTSELLRTFRNNIAYDTGYGPIYVESGALYTHNNNSWDSSLRNIVNTDFVSLDVSQLSRPRKSDGALPDVSFGHLTANSSLIYAGVWVDVSLDGEGTPWHNPPSMGAYEYDASIDASTSIPTVTTTAVSDISTHSATSGGNVTHDGSIALTYKGICWKITENPTTADSSSLNASTGEGSYVNYLTGLNASTHYHVRAFAYNSTGTAYGIDVSFNTTAAPVIPPFDVSVKTIHAFGKILRARGKLVKL